MSGRDRGYSRERSPRRRSPRRRYSPRRRSPSPRYRRRDDRRDDRRRDFRRNDRRRSRDRDDRGRYGRDDRYRRRGGRGQREDVDEALDAFRHPSLSLTPPRDSEELDKSEVTYELDSEEIAYVFGRMGTTKDKLARVSGTKMELRVSTLVISGEDARVKIAKHLVKILLDQREGTVTIDPKEHEKYLTLVDVPTRCKGFVTGRGGATLRGIERECATLMTFCKDGESDNEPLAIFGTRRGRLTAQMKIMSIVEGKEENWFCKDGDHPDISIPEPDAYDDWGVEFVKLEKDMLGYALGKRGNTRQKLQVASGCVIQYIGIWAAFGGGEKDRERGMSYLKWLIDQRTSDFKVDISKRDDVSWLWVPEPSVGYVTGKNARTLRNLENKSGTFCFFDKRKSGRAKEKMLIFASEKKHRLSAIDEVHTIVDFHQKKIGANQRASSTYKESESRSKSRSKSGSKSRSKSRSKRRSKSRSKRRSKSRSKRRSKSKSKSTHKRRSKDSVSPGRLGSKSKSKSLSRSKSRSRSYSKKKKRTVD